MGGGDTPHAKPRPRRAIDHAGSIGAFKLRAWEHETLNPTPTEQKTEKERKSEREKERNRGGEGAEP